MILDTTQAPSRLHGLARHCAVVTTLLLSVETTQAGELVGRVSDVRGETPLQGARVRIVELKRVAVAERDGRYRIANVPGGRYTVRAEYVGADVVETEVEVSDTGRTAQDLRLGTGETRLEDLLVVGYAAGQAAALSQQRAASNIKTIVAADAIGRFPDQNVAESLQRLPGVSLARDQGEGRFVVIRGIDPALSSTTINGVRVPGPESDSRQVNLDVISSDLLEGLEVTKSTTPDMDGDSVGGNIEIKSATALDRGNSFNARVEGSYNELADETSPKLAISGTRLFGNGDFGAAFALSWFSRDFGSDGVEPAGWPGIEGPGGEFNGIEEGEQRDYVITRERLSAALNFDWQPASSLDLYWRTLYSEFSDDEVQTTNVYLFADGDVLELDDSAALWENATVEKLTEFRKETQTIFSTTVGAEHRAGAWTTNYTLGYASAEEDNPGALGATFVGEGLTLGYSASNREIPRLFADDDAYFDGGSFVLDEVVLEDSFTEEQETVVALDLRRDAMFGSAPGFVKFGAKARLREKDGNLDAFIYDGFPEDFTLADFAAENIDYPLGVFGPAASRGGVRSFFADNRAALELNDDDSAIDSAIEDYALTEDILAGYAMASADVGALRIVGGVRVERTEYSARGTRLLIDEDTGSGDVELSALSRDKEYTDVLPSLNLRYEFSERLLLRAAYSQTIARPGFEQSAPRQAIEITVDEDDEGNIEIEREAEFGNPDLDPLSAQNLDLAIEFYPGGLSAMSAGLFYKRIEDFFVIADVAGQSGEFEAFDEAVTTLNGDSATLFGLELAYTRKLKDLPAPFDGLLVSANATFTDSEARLPQRSEKAPLPRQSDTLWNLLLGYEKHGLRLRLAATWRDSYFDEVGDLDDPTTDRYVDDHLQIDLIAGYLLTPNWEVYLNAINLNDEPFYAYFDSPRFAAQYEEYGPTYEVGMKLSF